LMGCESPVAVTKKYVMKCYTEYISLGCELFLQIIEDCMLRNVH